MAKGNGLQLFVLVAVCVVGANTGMLQAHVYCFDRPTVYADGVLIGSNTGTDHHWTGEVADDTKLLAVKCYNVEADDGDGFCGFMVSVVDILVSDKSWKCTTNEPRDNGWYGLEFKDDDWGDTSLNGGNRGSFRPTVKYGTETLYARVYVDSFPRGIDFITHDSDRENNDPTLYCRGRTGMALFLQHVGTACEVYADQQVVGYENILRKTSHDWSVTVPRTTRLIAVALTHYASYRSHIAVRGPFGIKSTTRWRCSSTGGAGWNSITFDDSNWPDAKTQSGISLSEDVKGATPVWAGSGSRSLCRGWIECGCQHKCKVTGDDFTCLCPDGHVLNGDKRTCRDCGCEYKCNVTWHDFTCLCRDGYVLNGDNKTCRDFNECIEKSKDNPFIPLHDCNQSNQTCVNKPGSYECECRDGFTSYDNGHRCNDVNECVEETHTCSGLFYCVNTFGSFNCKCPDGYHKEEDSSGVSSCVDDNECNPQTPDISLHDCEQVCNNLDGSYECACIKGYNLEADGRHCNDIDECVTGENDCPGTFSCINTEGSYQCECRPGHRNVTRNSVSICVDNNECEKQNGGCDQICNNTLGSYKCDCYEGNVLQCDGRTCAAESTGSSSEFSSGFVVSITVNIIQTILLIVIGTAFFIRRRHCEKKGAMEQSNLEPVFGLEERPGVEESSAIKRSENKARPQVADTAVNAEYEQVDQPPPNPYESLAPRASPEASPYEHLP